MYDNMTKNQTIDYDSNFISKIKEMINEGFDKLNSFIKIKSSKFKAYNELEEKFNDIANNLEKYDYFNDELTYFLLISDEILYIIYQNCENTSFGHCDFALELFNFFIEIWNEKIRLTKNYSSKELKKNNIIKLNFKNRYHEYRREFYWNIYEYSDDFDEDEMYEFAKSLKSD